MYTNAEKLASVVSYWAKPAISQIATSKLMQIPFMQSAQASLMASGLVGDGYQLSSDIEPFIAPIVDNMVTPLLTRYISGIPDDAIPSTAKAIVQQMLQQQTLTILDGLVTFDADDILELSDLLDKNLPVTTEAKYELIK